MGGSNCAVSGCINSTARIYKWRAEPCPIHEEQTRKECGCWLNPPYKLYCFPSELRNSDKRKKWVAALKRINKDKSWKPCSSDRVCSEHFADGIPTSAHPDPSLKMGYDVPSKKSRRELFCLPVAQKWMFQAAEKPEAETTYIEDEVDMSFVSTPSSSMSVVSFEHSYTSSNPREKCISKSVLIKSLTRKVNNLTLQLRNAKREKIYNANSNSVFCWRKIKTDKKMNFYTGISSIALFNVIFSLLSPFLSNLKYWRGAKRSTSYRKVKRKTKTIPKTKKLSYKNEMLFTLMRLRLGLLNQDLADRFQISPTICSNTFTTWIKLMSKILGHALIVWLPREPIRENLPVTFIKSGHSKCRIIIDCIVIFIERPKSLINQASTWSDYKHHNTVKCFGRNYTKWFYFISV